MLFVFLTISFPIQEFFHNHHSLALQCESETAHHHDDQKTIHKKCKHKAHFTKSVKKHVCFFTDFNNIYVATSLESIFFSKTHFEKQVNVILKLHYLKCIKNYLLRGPPLY